MLTRRPAGPSRPPVSLTRLVGRDREIAEVERLVAGNRLVTLTGMGGAGKTRLASELALRTDWQRADSVVWTELAPCTEPIAAAQQLAVGLSLREGAEQRVVDAVVEALREREMLVIFDNCEHLIDACAELAGTLLSHCPRVRILATSREPLGVAGERVWPVPPLSLPNANANDPVAIAAAESVELFVDRAAAVDPSFALTSDNAPAVVEICRTLDGIPLAIELAAARVRLLTPEQIAARLEDRFTILAGGARTTVPRHRTLRAAIDWSFALLNEREQKLLARLYVFASGFSIESVEAVCTDDFISRAEVLDLVGSLVDKSLVVCAKRHSAVRYSLLETIRRYAEDHVGNEAHELRRRHALAFLALARDAVPFLMTGTVDRIDRLGADRENIRAALTWSVEHEPDAIALPLAAAFRWYWYYQILWSEGRRWMTRVLERSSDALSHDRASVLTGLGTLAGYLGDLRNGQEQLEAGEAMWRALGDDRELALNLTAQAQLLATSGELETAAARAEEGLRHARNVGIPYDIGYCLTNGSAFVAQRSGRMEEADRWLEEAQAIWIDPPHDLGLPLVLNARALVAMRRNDKCAAARFARQALMAARDRRELWFSSRSLRILAITTEGNPLRAARLLGAAEAMLSSIAAGMLLHERNEHARLVETLRETLTPETFEATLQEGRRMGFEEACDLALSEGAIEADPQPHLLHVSDLGALRITLDGKPLEFEGRSSGRARELLVFLLAHPDGRRREEVGVAFWPDASSDQVKNSFHVTLHRLRKMLGNADAVSGEGGRYRIALPYRLDSKRFEEELTAALRSGTASTIEAALSLYHGDFLQGEDAGEWCLETRKHLRQLYLRGLFALGQSFEAQGRYADAADTYALLIAREPFHEAGSRQLMICRARLGARTDALLVYRDLEQRLRDDLASAPEPETRSLYRRLQQNEAV